MAIATVTGGTAPYPYTYIWDDPGTQSTDTATGLCAGTYNVIVNVIVIDAAGDSVNATVTLSTLPGMDELDWNNLIDLFPNPNPGKFSIRITVPVPQQVSYRIHNIQGQEILYNNLGRVEGIITEEIELNESALGIYYVQIIADNGTHIEKVVIK